ncbi:hypothetical protein V6N13_141337 [Hibiscus sabdariffa]|uniref:Uncharacterized protein n=1 Tax=Hibiscus sabdariffa TaxID=183260 RepID=A0ABR2P4Q4_9ROSI
MSALHVFTYLDYGVNTHEEIQKKTGFIVMRADGIFDVDANTSIDRLSEDLHIKFPEAFILPESFACEAFGYIPRRGESIKVILQKGDREDDENSEAGSDHQDPKERHQIYKLDVWFEPFFRIHFYCITLLLNSITIIRVLSSIIVSKCSSEGGNARKASAVRFKRINDEEALLDTTEVTPRIPKIMKRKRSNDEDSNNGNHDEDAFLKRLEDDLSDHYITADHNENK